jgi:hypothetical protein
VKVKNGTTFAAKVEKLQENIKKSWSQGVMKQVVLGAECKLMEADITLLVSSNRGSPIKICPFPPINHRCCPLGMLI